MSSIRPQIRHGAGNTSEAKPSQIPRSCERTAVVSDLTVRLAYAWGFLDGKGNLRQGLLTFTPKGNFPDHTRRSGKTRLWRILLQQSLFLFFLTRETVARPRHCF